MIHSFLFIYFFLSCRRRFRHFHRASGMRMRNGNSVVVCQFDFAIFAGWCEFETSDHSLLRIASFGMIKFSTRRKFMFQIDTSIEKTSKPPNLSFVKETNKIRRKKNTCFHLLLEKKEQQKRISTNVGLKYKE